MSSYLPDNESPPDDYGNCPVFLERYLEYCKNNLGKRPTSLVEQCLILREFCQYIHYCRAQDEKPDFKDAHKDMNICKMEISELACVCREELEEYICFLDETVGNSSATVRKKIIFIRQLFAYLVRLQDELGISFPDGDPAAELPLPTVRASEATVLTVRQIEKLLSSVAGENELRDRAMILLIATAGLSLSEVAGLNRTDVVNEEWLRVRGANKTRYVYLTVNCRAALRSYIAFCRSFEDNECDTMFSAIRHPEKHLTARMIRNCVARASTAAGLENLGITPKTLRDTAAVIMTQTAGESGRFQVLDYLGYKLDSRLKNRFDDTQQELSAENPFMKDIVERSPLNELGG